MAEALLSPAKPQATRKRGKYAKSGETRERILAAALKVAGVSGLHAASIAAIAEEAGVAIGNVNYHFGSRDELLYELMQWLVSELLDAVRSAIEGHDDFFAKDEAALRAYVAYVRRNPACVRLAEEVRLHHPKLYEETNAMWLAMFRDAIREGVECGQLRAMRDDEIWVLAHLLMGARYFIDQIIHASGRKRISDDAIVATYIGLTRDGLARAVRTADPKLRAASDARPRAVRRAREKRGPA